LNKFHEKDDHEWKSIAPALKAVKTYRCEVCGLEVDCDEHGPIRFYYKKESWSQGKVQILRGDIY